MKKSSIAIIGLFLLLYIVPLGVRPIVIPDETRYGEIAREMIASDDWVVPRLNGLRYFEKPVLGYWLNAGSLLLFGENAFAVRFPSALAAGLSALMLFIMVRRFAGGYSAALLSAAVFLTCLLVSAVGTLSVLDSLLSLFITGAMVAFFYAHMEKRPERKYGLLALAGMCCGLAFLIKGFLAFAVTLVVIVPFMVWERRWKELLRVCWLPVLTALLIILPWAVMIQIREPDFWSFFFWNEHIRRFMSDSAQHKASFWYFFLLLPTVAVPWTFLFPAVISGFKKVHFERPVIRFAVCWFLFPLFFFSLSNGKLITYILPCFPPLAILLVTGLDHYFEKGRSTAFNIGARSLALVVTIIAVTLLVLQLVGFDGLRLYSENWKWVLAIAGLLFWAVFLLLSARESEHPPRKILLYTAAPVLLMFLAPFILPDVAIERTAPGEFLLDHSHRIQPDTILVTDEDPVGAVCWYYKRNNIYLLGGAGELAHGLSYKDSKHRFLSVDQFNALVSEHRGTGRVTLIAKAGRYKDRKAKLPKPIFEDANGNDGFVFAQF